MPNPMLCARDTIVKQADIVHNFMEITIWWESLQNIKDKARILTHVLRLC